MNKKKFRFLLLYIIGIALFIFGNRNLWEKWKVEKTAIEEKKKQYAEASRQLTPKFEVQTLTYDSINRQWTNPHLYFQLINVSYVNFKALNNSKNIRIEIDNDEDASDSN